MTVECKSLDEVRANIDRLDRAIIPLLAERGAYVLQAARFKPNVADVPAPARVEDVIQHVMRLAHEHGAIPDVVEKTYRAMIAAFIAAEHHEHGTIWKNQSQKN
jgi:isochorismate pyruvate lyase